MALVGLAAGRRGARGSPNDRIRVAVIGLGGRGRGHVREAGANRGVVPARV